MDIKVEQLSKSSSADKAYRHIYAAAQDIQGFTARTPGDNSPAVNMTIKVDDDSDKDCKMSSGSYDSSQTLMTVSICSKSPFEDFEHAKEFILQIMGKSLNVIYRADGILKTELYFDGSKGRFPIPSESNGTDLINIFGPESSELVSEIDKVTKQLSNYQVVGPNVHIDWTVHHEHPLKQFFDLHHKVSFIVTCESRQSCLNDLTISKQFEVALSFANLKRIPISYMKAETIDLQIGQAYPDKRKNFMFMFYNGNLASWFDLRLDISEMMRERHKRAERYAQQLIDLRLLKSGKELREFAKASPKVVLIAPCETELECLIKYPIFKDISTTCRLLNIPIGFSSDKLKLSEIEGLLRISSELSLHETHLFIALSKSQQLIFWRDLRRKQALITIGELIRDAYETEGSLGLSVLSADL